MSTIDELVETGIQALKYIAKAENLLEGLKDEFEQKDAERSEKDEVFPDDEGRPMFHYRRWTDGEGGDNISFSINFAWARRWEEDE